MAEVSQDNALDILEWMLAQLPEDKLEELDKYLGSQESGEPTTGMDAALQKRMDWVRLGVAGRNAVRAGRRRGQAQDAASARDMDARFPNNRRLKW